MRSVTSVLEQSWSLSQGHCYKTAEEAPVWVVVCAPWLCFCAQVCAFCLCVCVCVCAHDAVSLLNRAKRLCIIYNLSTESHLSFSFLHCFLCHSLSFPPLLSLFKESLGEGSGEEVEAERARAVAEQEKLSLLKRQLLHVRDPSWGRD